VITDFSVAITTDVHQQLVEHLVRADEQEDLTFLVWHPSVGATRDTAVVSKVIWPADDERNVHGNVSFESSYFLRACTEAAELGGGVALIHSHPGGRRWQHMSEDDYNAESGHAGQAMSMTGLPMVGLTMAGATHIYSSRRWHRTAPRQWEPQWAQSVRVVGDQLILSLPCSEDAFDRTYQRRTVDAWGPEVQHIIGSLRVAVVGAGSVGSQIVEALARSGFGDVVVMDFDHVEDHNLDRIINATSTDAAASKLKAQVAAEAALRHATHPRFRARWTNLSAVEAAGLALLKDCDLIFACVDRPAGRQALNALAFAHLIPVIDGGVMVTPGRRGMRGAEWRAHVVAPGRKCMECLKQFDAALVQADRDGLLADPAYLAMLPADHVLNRNQNVFAFSAAAAAEQVLAALRMVVAPSGIADVGAQTFHFTTGTVDRDAEGCSKNCLSHEMTMAADAGLRPTGARHKPAEDARGQHDPVVVEVTSAVEEPATLRARILRWLGMAVRGWGN
jgi:molybdopterin-synthase adenylyltransferase